MTDLESYRQILLKRGINPDERLDTSMKSFDRASALFKKDLAKTPPKLVCNYD